MVYAALLDTSVVIDLESIGDQQVAAALGVDISEFRPGISTVTLAELAAGPHATDDPAERVRRLAPWRERPRRRPDPRGLLLLPFEEAVVYIGVLVEEAPFPEAAKFPDFITW